MKKVDVREKQTNWKELFKAFFSSDEQIEETDNGLNKYMNDPEYINDFDVANKSIKSLEGMLKHSDKKSKKENFKKTRKAKNKRAKCGK